MLDLTKVVLKPGKHSKESGEACLLEAVSIYCELPFSDRPKTVCPVIAAYGRTLNDSCPDDVRAKLVSLIPRFCSTKDVSKELKRAFICADWAIKKFAKIDVPQIVDRESTLVGRDAAKAADAAYYSAEAAKAAKAAKAADAAYYSANAVVSIYATNKWDLAIDLLNALLDS